jgi:hypothetical protein
MGPVSKCFLCPEGSQEVPAEDYGSRRLVLDAVRLLVP